MVSSAVETVTADDLSAPFGSVAFWNVQSLALLKLMFTSVTPDGGEIRTLAVQYAKELLTTLNEVPVFCSLSKVSTVSVTLRYSDGSIITSTEELVVNSTVTVSDPDQLPLRDTVSSCGTM